MLLVVNEHSAQLDRGLGECRGDYEILIEAIINAQKGSTNHESDEIKSS
jgi:hypothetical protein